MRPVVYPYNIGSGSARRLARLLNTVCVREAGTFRPKQGHLIINWGSPRIPLWVGGGAIFGGWVNKIRPVAIAQNKL